MSDEAAKPAGAPPKPPQPSLSEPAAGGVPHAAAPTDVTKVAPAEPAPTRTGNAAKFVMVLVLFAVVAFAVADTVPWYRPVGGGEESQPIAEALFERYVVAFEVLGILLTAALFGSMYLAIREGSP